MMNLKKLIKKKPCNIILIDKEVKLKKNKKQPNKFSKMSMKLITHYLIPKKEECTIWELMTMVKELDLILLIYFHNSLVNHKIKMLISSLCLVVEEWEEEEVVVVEASLEVCSTWDVWEVVVEVVWEAWEACKTYLDKWVVWVVWEVWVEWEEEVEEVEAEALNNNLENPNNNNNNKANLNKTHSNLCLGVCKEDKEVDSEMEEESISHNYLDKWEVWEEWEEDRKEKKKEDDQDKFDLIFK